MEIDGSSSLRRFRKLVAAESSDGEIGSIGEEPLALVARGMNMGERPSVNLSDDRPASWNAVRIAVELHHRDGLAGRVNLMDRHAIGSVGKLGREGRFRDGLLGASRAKHTEQRKDEPKRRETHVNQTFRYDARLKRGFEQRDQIASLNWTSDRVRTFDFGEHCPGDAVQLLARRADIAKPHRHLELRDKLCGAVRALQSRRARICRVKANSEALRDGGKPL